MKQSIRIGSLIIAVMMAFTTVLASGCSFNKEWSYKTADEELAIGAYIYSMDIAYNQALGYAKELDDYDGTKDSWLDMEITDDDGNKAVARQWIKDKAEEMCLSYLAVSAELDKLGASVDEAILENSDSQAKTLWDSGQYASMGYYYPMSAELEPYGISYDSFKRCTSLYTAERQSLFTALYDVGGTKEVKVDELKKYFEEKYVSYSYRTIDLFDSTTDEAGEQVDVAYSDDKIKEIQSDLDKYVDAINGGESIDDVMKRYAKANGIDENNSPLTASTELYDNFSLGSEAKEAFDKLETKHATTVKIGSGDSAIIYFIYKNDVKDLSDTYVSDNRTTLLQEFKLDEFEDYIKELAKNLKHEKNTSAVDSYDPKMFFIAEEPATTEAAESAATPDSE